MAAATTAPNPLHRYRTHAMVEVGRRVVLLYIFKSGTNKSDSEFLDKYLQGLPASSNANYPRMSKKAKKFNKIELDRINRDSTCDSFDTSLLYKTIRFACKYMKPCDDPAWETESDELEYCITAVKNFRNECNHGPHEITLLEYKKTYNDLRILYHKTLNAAGKKYTLTPVEVDAKKQEVDSELRKIDREILGMDDLLSYYGPRLKMDLIAEADAQLRTNLEAAKSINPMSFLTGISLNLDINDVFTEVKVTQGNRREDGTSVIPVDKLSIERKSGNTKPKVLLVEGVAGSGKSTLVAKVITEWLENAKEPTISGLQQYKLLLRVQCRDRGVKSMEGLLENVMPQVFGKFRGCLVPIFKECSVLFFIDGLDEANEDSTALIRDILQCMNNVRDCALVITSRPEGIQTFERKIPSGYEKFYVNLKGIEEAQRKSFVERYHHSLQSKTGIVRNTTEFVQKVTHVLLQESFRLPLNMVFLTWVDLKSPDVITATVTQTQLYVSSHQLLFERLVDRVIPSSHQDVRTLKRNLEKCLEALQKECLLALWDLQLTLKEEAVDRIWDACEKQNVPPRDVLSSFLSLRMSRSVLGVFEEQYVVPHMGLQEFSAALCIKRHLSSTRGIRSVLQDILQTSDIKLSVFQNMFKHVAGLVHHISDMEVEALSKEVVDLLWESGMRQKDSWHDLVEETKAADPIIRRVAHHYPIYNYEEITDSRVFSYTALLPHLPPSCVSINFNRDLEGQEARIEDLIGALDNHRCVKLVLHHHFRHPVPSIPTYQLVKKMMFKFNLETFIGYVKTEDLQFLFKSPLKSLSLVAKGNDHARGFFPALETACRSRRRLDRITIHIPVAATTPDVEVTHDAVSQLNIKPRLTLILSGVGETKLEEAVRVACAICPKGKPYWGMRFPGATLGRESWHRLIEGLAAGGVKVRDGFRVPRLKLVTREKRGRLNNLSKSLLGSGMARWSEEMLWSGKI